VTVNELCALADGYHSDAHPFLVGTARRPSVDDVRSEKVCVFGFTAGRETQYEPVSRVIGVIDDRNVSRCRELDPGQH